MQGKLTEYEQRAIQTINENISLQSLLYDIDLLPEQLERGSYKWTLMGVVASAFRMGAESVKAESKSPTIEELSDRVNKLKALLDNPQPGLATWNEFMAEHLKFIAGTYNASKP